MELIYTFAASILTAIISSAGTVAAIRTDMNWIKIILNKHDDRITKLEDK